MNKRIRIFSIVCVILLVAVTAAFSGNDNTGTSVGNFLKIGVGSRAVAMGNAYVALANDVTALYWNPAGIANIAGTEIGVSYTNWILDINHNFVGIVHNLGGFGVIGVSFNYLSMGEMERTTPEEPHGTGVYFDASDMAVGVAYARNLTDRFSAGIKVKYVRETIGYCSAGTMALDAGTQFVTGFHGMRLGMSVSNFSAGMQMSGTDQIVKTKREKAIEGVPEEVALLRTDKFALPLTFRFGISLDLLKSEMNRFTVNTDYTDPRDVAPIGNFGVEYGWNDLIYLRGGVIYRSEDYDEQLLKDEGEVAMNYDVTFSFGGGLNLPVPGLGHNVQLDYAYTDLGILTTVHQFSFRLEL